ncbi:MAG: hypothetical protein M1816_001830 [Peltula sp. TS41687]|nr:MAG: hypothetical protein M1816_001830 [Peltula sp. TS41687]
MPPVAPPSDYCPPLDRCLEGDELLLSWKTAFIGLSSMTPDLGRDSSQERFLSDTQTVRLLQRPFNAFSTPTPQTKAVFQTLTAAIHLTPKNDGRYDGQQLKSDVVWLTNAAKIDEISALRIVIIELQSRAESQLASGLTEEESTSLQDIVGTPADALSASLPPLSTAGAFESESNRRARLARLYLSERRHLLKVTEILVRTALSKGLFADRKGKRKATLDWVDGLGKTILNARCSGGTSFEPFLNECLLALRQRIDGLQSGSGFQADPSEDTDLELEWGKCLLLEMIHILQLMFTMVNSLDSLPSMSFFLAWSRFVGEYAFFDKFGLPVESLQVLVPPFQSLISIISLDLLKLPRMVEFLLNSPDDTPAPSPDTHPPFILDTSSIYEIHSTLMAAADSLITVAGPMLFAWGIILQTLREVVSSRKEKLDVEQSQHAVEGFPETDTSTTGEGSSSPTQDRHLWTGPTPPPFSSADGALQRTVLEYVLKSVMHVSPNLDPIQYLAKCVVNGTHVFDVIYNLASKFCTIFMSEGNGEAGLRMRMVLLELIRYSRDWVQYVPEVISATLGVLTADESFWSFVDRSKLPDDFDPVAAFLGDNDTLTPKLLGVALARFPLEILPLLNFLKALSAGLHTNKEGKLSAIAILESMESHTQALPAGFRAYDTIREEENTNQVILRADMRLFTDRGIRTLSASHNQKNGAEIIPNGTEGRVVDDSNSIVVQWIYKYSGLRHLGKLLESVVESNNVADNLSHLDSEKGITTETIKLFAVLLTSLRKLSVLGRDPGATEEAAHRLLAEASQGIGQRSGDVITVILAVFENEIQEPRHSPADEWSMNLLISCTHFIFALTPILPGRVWPFLARSGLLDLDGRGGRLAEIVTSAEIVTGHFDFLIGCIRVFEALVEEAIAHAVARKATNTAPTRFAKANNLGTGISVQVMSKVILAFVRALVDTFESFSNWRYAVLDEKLEIGRRILTVFDTILLHTQGIDDANDPNDKITSMLNPAASYLMEVFLSPSSTSVAISPLLGLFSDGVKTPHTTLFFATTDLWIRQTISALKFSTTLIRVGASLGRQGARLETRIFQVAPLLVRTYSASISYRRPVVALLEAMITSAASAKGEPLSLPGHLGPQTARNFLHILSRFSRPLEDEELDMGIWNLMSAIVSSRQQWFAIYLLTGSPPRESLSKSGDAAKERSTGDKHILGQALDGLATINQISPKSALVMLEFVASAGDYWPWSVSEVHKRQEVLSSLSDYLDDLRFRINVTDNNKSKETCDALRMSSLILDIFAIYIHYAQQFGDTSFAKQLVSKIDWSIAEKAVVVDGYNFSLHANLKKNFEARFPGCRLSSFRRTKSVRVELGSNYYYNIDYARKMLEHDSSWLGVRGSGLQGELERANNNLSVIEAQTLLLYSWRILMLELSCVTLTDPSLQELMIEVVTNCMVSNSNRNLPDNLFEQLVQVDSTLPDMKAILFNTWDSIKSSDTNLELAMATGDVEYYRPLLKILFLSLRAHMGKNTTPPPNSPPAESGAGQSSPSSSQQQQHQQRSLLPSTELQITVLDILDVVVSRGFRNLAVRIHENPLSSSPEDIALVTAILQTALHIPGMEHSHGPICNGLIDQDVARVAIGLFSWSDRLAHNNGGDPVYGELAMLFLLELSSLPPMAEHLAVDGILAQLSSAQLTAHTRRGVHALNGPHQRLYSIWTRGFLPVCLNLLRGIGPAIAPEVAHFLNQFAAQLTLATNTFDNKSATAAAAGPVGITLGMASEAHSLALLHRIVEGYRAGGASSGVLASDIPSLTEAGWNAAGVKEDVEYWLANRASLRLRLLPVSPREEEELVKEKPVGMGRKAGGVAGGCESRFEERVVGELSAVVGLLSE